MKKIPVTVIVPVKNEVTNLAKCLFLLGDFDQIMVIDSNSTDGTQDIAREFGAEVHQFYWNGHFPKKRNWALRHLEIRNEWVLFIDADEYVTDAFKIELQQKIKDSSFSGFRINFLNFFMGKLMKYGAPFIKLSLFRLGTGEYERVEEDRWSCLDMEVHEKLLINGAVGTIKAPIIHNDYKSLEKFIMKHNEYSTWEARRFLNLEEKGFENLSARQVLKYKLLRFGMLPIIFFLGSYFWRLGFLDGKTGFCYHIYKFQYFLQIQNKVEEFINKKELKSLINSERMSPTKTMVSYPVEK